MDKVKAALKYKFWILFGLAVPLVMYAYFSTSGTMQTATVEREQFLQTTLTGIKAGSNQPNDDWSSKLKIVADELDEANAQVRKRLWLDQLGDMDWPVVVAERMEPGYRSEIPRPEDKLVAVKRYADEYEEQINDLYKRFQPVVLGDEFKGQKVDWPQKLSIDQTEIPRDPTIRPERTITLDAMWDAQEDIWLTRVLADALVEVNRDAENIAQSVVRRVDELRLLGGDGTPVAGSAAGGGMGGSYSGSTDSSYSGGMGGMSGPGGGGGGRGAVSIDFSPAEEFGAGGDPGAGSALGGFGGGPGSYGSSMGGDPTSGAAAAKIERYIGDDEAEADFRERGFYLRVIVQQDQIAEFLTTLSSARWPIKLARFQIGQNPYYDEKAEQAVDDRSGYGGGGGGFSGPGGGGYPGSGGGGYPGSGGSGYPGSGGFGGGGGYPGSGGDGGYPGGGGFGGPGGFGGGYGSDGGSGFTGGTAGRISDPVVKTALATPELVQLTVAGSITVFMPPNEEMLPVDRDHQPVPIIGQPYAPPASRTEDELAMREAGKEDGSL